MSHLERTSPNSSASSPTIYNRLVQDVLMVKFYKYYSNCKAQRRKLGYKSSNNCASLNCVIPSASAFANLEPASSPTTK